jgi:hypothetical protein
MRHAPVIEVIRGKGSSRIFDLSITPALQRWDKTIQLSMHAPDGCMHMEERFCGLFLCYLSRATHMALLGLAG